jgi:hypothetical protein
MRKRACALAKRFSAVEWRALGATGPEGAVTSLVARVLGWLDKEDDKELRSVLAELYLFELMSTWDIGFNISDGQCTSWWSTLLMQRRGNVADFNLAG